MQCPQVVLSLLCVAAPVHMSSKHSLGSSIALSCHGPAASASPSTHRRHCGVACLWQEQIVIQQPGQLQRLGRKQQRWRNRG